QITQETPLMVKKQTSQAQELDKNEQDLYERHKSTELDVSLNGKLTTVMPFNLTSMHNFKKFLNSKKGLLSPEQLDAVNKNDPMTINKFLLEVSDKLGEE